MDMRSMKPRGAGSEPELHEFSDAERLATIRGHRARDRADQAYTDELERKKNPRKFWRQFANLLLFLAALIVIILWLGARNI